MKGSIGRVMGGVGVIGYFYYIVVVVVNILNVFNFFIVKLIWKLIYFDGLLVKKYRIWINIKVMINVFNFEYFNIWLFGRLL